MKPRRLILPTLVFVTAGLIHFAWLGMFPENDPAQARWQTVVAGESSSWLSRYLEAQSYWLGYSYALSLAFAAVALRRYQEQRMCVARNLAVGGVTLTGFLAFAGCFLIGCCGSPMLGVYLSLFGASFLPWAKPLVAGLTTVMIAASYWWMRSRSRRAKPSAPCCTPPAVKPGLQSVLTCPQCGVRKEETMPTDSCQFIYECTNCHTLLRPKPGDCCVFCSYGSVKCPPKQVEAATALVECR